MSTREEGKGSGGSVSPQSSDGSVSPQSSGGSVSPQSSGGSGKHDDLELQPKEDSEHGGSDSESDSESEDEFENEGLCCTVYQFHGVPLMKAMKDDIGGDFLLKALPLGDDGKRIYRPADCNIPALFGRKIIQHVCYYGKMNCLKTLVEGGANILEGEGKLLTPLHIAVTIGSLPMVKFLVDTAQHRGLDTLSRMINSTTLGGLSPRDSAKKLIGKNYPISLFLEFIAGCLKKAQDSLKEAQDSLEETQDSLKEAEAPDNPPKKQRKQV
ncbi:hypothetical protein OROGR_027267 [Orobanche gracilis]